MATPGNQNTTDAKVLLAIVDEINDASSINDHVVSISADPSFLGVSYAGDHYIQVIPGSVEDRIGTGDGSGVHETEFSVVVYKRLVTDLANQDTKKITHATLGLLSLIDDIDAQLVNSMLGGIVLTPIIPISRESILKPKETAQGWAASERRYSVLYKVSYPEIKDQS